MNGFGFLETTWQDLRYSLRAMRKNPAFAVAALLTVSLGIGGNTAMFTVIRSVLLRPLNYGEPDRLVYLSADNARRDQQDFPFTEIRLEEMRSSARSFSGIGAFLGSAEDVTLSGAGDPEALKAARVSGNFLKILAVQPRLGRSFLPEEDTPRGSPVAMISARLWQRRFGGDPLVIGKTVTLNAIPHAIVGVLPANFSFPFPNIDVWVPRPSEWSRLPARYWSTVTLLKGFARLKPRVSLQQAQSEMAVLNGEYLAAHPDFGAVPGITMRVAWLKNRLVANVRPMLLILFGAVGFVLLIACSNVAGLMLARLTSRSREFALRAALGAGRGRLIRQLLTESLILSVAGGLLGFLEAKWISVAIARSTVFTNPTRLGALSVPGAGEVRLDLVVLAFTVVLSIATGVFCGLFPSLRMSRPDLAAVLRESGAAADQSASRRRGRFGVSARSVLVAGQLALSIVLLIGAALLMESVARLHKVDPGFRTDSLLTMKLALPLKRYDTAQKRTTFFDQVLTRVQAVRGVENATAVLSLPTTPWLWTDIKIEGQPPTNPNELPTAQLQSVTPGYFRTLNIPLERGREFTARDNAPNAPPVVIINESFAHRFWPSYPNGPNPVGLHIFESADKSAGGLEIVGVTSNVHEGGLAMEPLPEFYVPFVVHPPQTAYLAVRTKGDPSRLVNAIRMRILAVDRDQPLADVMPMQARFDAVLGQPRLTMVLLQVFAAVALLLALIGLYGAIAYSVVQRTQEMGIRRALGAQQSDILGLVLKESLYLVLAGSGFGIVGALALGRVMKGLLFGVRATDPVIFFAITTLFAIVALSAALLPAFRAARTDPMTALRGLN